MDLFAVVWMLSNREVIAYPSRNQQAMYDKSQKVLNYMKLARKNGALSE